MFEIFLNIFNYPEIFILGTFFRPDVGLGGGNSTGKIKFSNITTNGKLVEDSTGITISTFFNQAINYCQIAFGCGTGITSSKFFIYSAIPVSCAGTRAGRLIGPGMINSVSLGWNYNCNLNWGLYNHSFIINGCCNLIGQPVSGTLSFSDLIVGGFCNCSYPAIATSSFHNVILNGSRSCTVGSRGDVIIGSGKTEQTQFNVIINSTSEIEKPSSGNVIISSIYDTSEIGKGTKNPAYSCMIMIKESYNSSIISSINSKINYEKLGRGCNNLIIASADSNVITGYGGTTSINFNAIIGSRLSNIYGGDIANTYGTSTTKPSSCFSSIISSDTSHIDDSKLSSILGGFKNTIINDFSNGVDGYCRDLVSSSILGGYKNQIKVYNLSLNENIITSPSTIIGGQNNLVTMYTGKCGGNSILGGGFNYVFGRRSTIISSETSQIPNGYESVMISTIQSCMPAKSTNSLIISSTKVYQRGYIGAVDISSSNSENYGNCIGCSSLRLSTEKSFFDNNGSYMNSIISSSQVIIGSTPSYYSCYSTIISGISSVIRQGEFSSIILDANSYIKCSSTSNILSGQNNKLLYSSLSSIIGGFNNCIVNSLGSAILGGCENKIGDASLNTTVNSIILGGSKQTLTFSNTSLAKNFNFSSAEIFINLTQCCQVLVGTFSNCFYCSLKIRNGFIVS